MIYAQGSYNPYSYGGKSYDLLWVSSLQGGPLGLRELLLALGWSGSASSGIKAGSAVMTTGSNGNYGHTVVGVGSNTCDAHNNARYHQTSCSSYYTVNQVLNPPSAGDCFEDCVDHVTDGAPYVDHFEMLKQLGLNESSLAWP